MKTKTGTRIKLTAIIALLILALSAFCIYFAWQEEREALADLQLEALQMLRDREGEYDNGQIVLQNTTRTKAEAIAEAIGAKLRITRDGKFAALTLPAGTTIFDIYANSDYCRYLEEMSPDFYAQISETATEGTVGSKEPSRPQYTVTDPDYSEQTYLDYLHMENVWDTTKGGGITVAVIDTGIDTDHPEFAGKISEYSYNASEDKIVKDYLLEDGSYDWSLIEDEQGHGTSVSGVIAASMNEFGTVGIAPDVTLLVIKAECYESGAFLRSSDLAFGLYYAIERDADIVNMSFGTIQNIFETPANLAADSDIICVAAAGNEASTQTTYPAACQNVIGVGALKEGSWELADYSNYGENVNVVAPGTAYTTQKGGTYATSTGTSIACPAVTGGIALYLATTPYPTLDLLRETLYASTYDLGDIGEDWYFGYGAFDIYALVCEERGKVLFHMLTDELQNTEQIFIRNHTLQSLPEPERLYAIFDGWYYDIDCTERLNDFQDVFSADLTLYASWVNEDDGVPFSYVELADGTIEIRGYTGKRRYITIPEYIDGKPVTSIGEEAFLEESRLREITLPAQLRRIRRDAFAACNNLVYINMPNTLETIESGAFFDNIRLSGITFESGSALKSIGENAFYSCSNLKYVAFSSDSRLEQIDSCAFGGCISLQRFELPGSVSNVDGSAFYRTTRLKQFGILGTSPYFTVKDGVLLNYAESEIVAFPSAKSEEYRIPDGIRSIGTYAFAYSRLTEIDLKGIESIGSFAFENANLKALTIPDSVLSVGFRAFAANESLTSVSLGQGLSEIADETFNCCTVLESIHIPAGIVTIGGDAFSSCVSLKSLTFAPDSKLRKIVGNGIYHKYGSFGGCRFTEITLPKSLLEIGENSFSGTDLVSVAFEEGSALKTIGQAAFSSNRMLSHMELPEGLLFIEKRAFQSDKTLHKIDLPDSLQSIDDEAFAKSGLFEVSLPKSLSKLGVGAFHSCEFLENIFVDDRNPVYTGIDGVVYTIDKRILTAYPTGNFRTAYQTVSGTEEIGEGAFWGSLYLTEATLSEGITAVREKGFYECVAVTAYSLPETLIFIEAEAFSRNLSLLSIQIPDRVYQISNNAFAYDYNLSSIHFTENATLPRISYGAFAYTGVVSFRVPASVSTIAQNAFIGSYRLRELTFAAGSQVQSISAYMFAGSESLTNITFEPGAALTSIQAHGFEGMKNLKKVDFGDAKLENIDNYAFRFCESLKTLSIPEGVTYIGRYAFYRCAALERLDLPTTIDYIGENAFYFAENLNLFFAKDTLPPNLIKNWDNGIRGYYVGVKNVLETPEWDYAELNSGKLSIIRYKGNRTELDLNALLLGSEIVSLGGHSFYGSEVTSLILPDTLTEIHPYALAFTKIRSLTLPDSLCFIGQYAFVSSALEELHFGASPTLRTVEQYAFASCSALRSISLPRSLETLGRYAFAESGLSSVDFRNSALETIPEGAFTATKLTEVTLPDSLSLIDHNAFRDCADLKKVTFGTGTLQLMSNVFYNTGLSELYIPENITYIGEYALVGLLGLESFTVSAANEKYTAIDGLLYTKDGRKLIAAPAGKTGEITLPRSLEVLGFGAFENSRLRKISFHPESNILTFGYRCFYQSAISELYVPKTVVSFDFYAFAMCQNLTTVNLAADSELRGIYEGAFYGCRNLKHILIPESIVEISDYAFYGCTSLSALPFSESAKVKGIYDYAFAYTSFEEVVFPDTLIDIGNYAFFGSKLKKAEISSATASDLLLGIGIFEECYALEELTVPFLGASLDTKSIYWLGYFFGAGSPEANSSYVPPSLHTVTVKEGTTFIGPYAFARLEHLQTVNLPSSITAVFTRAFHNTSFTYELKSPVTYCTNFDKYGDVVPATVLRYTEIGTGLSGSLRIAEGALTAVDAHAFTECSRLTEITLPTSLTEIGNLAFYGCSSLKQVTFVPGSELTSLGNQAFAFCESLESITLPTGLTRLSASVFNHCSALQSVALPEGITAIEYGAFEACSALTNVALPSTVTEIAGYTFFECRSLREITLPAGLRSIGTLAFSYTALERISLPKCLEHLEATAFLLCDRLSEITVHAENSHYTFDGGILYNKEKTEILFVPASSTDLVIAAPVTSIGEIFRKNSTVEQISFEANSQLSAIDDNAFYEASALRSIEIPDNVTSIGASAFQSCTSLKRIQIGKTSKLASLGRYAFAGCTGLTQLTLASTKLTEISSYAFSNCHSLNSIDFGESTSIQRIGLSAFASCKALSSFTVPAGVTSIAGSAFSSCENLGEIRNNSSLTLTIGSTANGYVSYYAHLLIDKEGNRTYKYAGSDFMLLDTPDGFRFQKENGSYRLIAYIGDKETVTLPEKIEGSSYTISRMSGVKHVILPEGITSIAKNAFTGITTLKSIKIANSVTSIGDAAFQRCSALEQVIIDRSASRLSSIGTQAFDYCTKLTSIELPNGITSIPSSAFEICSSLSLCVLPDGLVSIGSKAFLGCRALSNVTLPEGLTSLGFSAFAGCDSLTYVFLPDTLTTLGSGAFTDCSSLYEISLSKQNQYFSFANGILYDKNRTKVLSVLDTAVDIVLPASITSVYHVFRSNTLIRSVAFESGCLLEQIDTEAFYGCTSLQSIALPSSIKTIEEWAFLNCSALERVEFPEINALETVGNLAFQGCTSLREIRIPDTVRTIGRSAFQGCSSLERIDIGKESRLTSIGAAALSGCSQLTALQIPKSLTRIGTFTDCGSLSVLSLHPENTSFVLEDGILYNKERTSILIVSASVRDVVIPKGVNTIGTVFRANRSLRSLSFEEGSLVTALQAGAFESCTSLERITVPPTLTQIGDSVFLGCTALAAFEIPNSVTSIGSYAFNGCQLLRKINLPEKITLIPEGIFGECTNLAEITVPANVTRISLYAFLGCYNLQVVTNKSSLALSIGSSDHGRILSYAKLLIDREGNRIYASSSPDVSLIDTPDGFRFIKENGIYRLIAYIGDSETATLPLTVNGSPYEIYQMTGAVHLTVPEGITQIPSCAFQNSITLKSIRFANSVVLIGEYAFENCTSLESVLFHKEESRLAEIWSYAFSGCSSLSDILLPDHITKIDLNAFAGSHFFLRGDNRIHGCLYSGRHLIDAAEDATEVTVDGCVAINALKNAHKIRKATVGGDRLGVFSDLFNLVTLVISETPSNDLFRYFSEDPNTVKIPLTLKNILLPEGVEITANTLFRYISNVTVYTRSEQIKTQWDHDYPDWNNGNKVYYAGEWIEAAFFDGEGNSFGDTSFYPLFQIVRQPFVADFIDGSVYHRFVGWDIDGDGIADALPATLKSDLSAVAVYQPLAICEALGHTEGDWEIALLPTCTAEGSVQKTCTVCGEILLTASTAPLGHDLLAHESKAPTCSEIGWEAYVTCSRCDHSTYTQLPADPSLHRLLSHAAQAPTCTLVGWNAYETCSKCSYSTYLELPARGHDTVSHAAQPGTCTTVGWKAYETCTRCDYTTYAISPALGHDIIHHDAKAATCTEEGWYSYVTCARCEYSTFLPESPRGHDILYYGEKPATCTDTGYCAYELCSVCGYSTYAEIPAFGHRMENHASKEATCTEVGWHAYESCSRCGLSNYTEIPAFGHDLQNHKDNPPTCTMIGYTAYETCSRCSYSTYTELPALGHQLQSYPGNAPTCTSIGWAAYETCTRCDHSTYVELPPLGHEMQEYAAKEASCTDIGWHAYEICSACGYSTYSEIASYGHDIVTHEPKDPNYTEVGWTAYESCTRCDYTTYSELPAFGLGQKFCDEVARIPGSNTDLQKEYSLILTAAETYRTLPASEMEKVTGAYDRLITLVNQYNALADRINETHARATRHSVGQVLLYYSELLSLAYVSDLLYGGKKV